MRKHVLGEVDGGLAAFDVRAVFGHGAAQLRQCTEGQVGRDAREHALVDVEGVAVLVPQQQEVAGLPARPRIAAVDQCRVRLAEGLGYDQVDARVVARRGQLVLLEFNRDETAADVRFTRPREIVPEIPICGLRRLRVDGIQVHLGGLTGVAEYRHRRAADGNNLIRGAVERPEFGDAAGVRRFQRTGRHAAVVRVGDGAVDTEWVLGRGAGRHETNHRDGAGCDERLTCPERLPRHLLSSPRATPRHTSTENARPDFCPGRHRDICRMRIRHRELRRSAVHYLVSPFRLVSKRSSECRCAVTPDSHIENSVAAE